VFASSELRLLFVVLVVVCGLFAFVVHFVVLAVVLVVVVLLIVFSLHSSFPFVHRPLRRPPRPARRLCVLGVDFCVLRVPSASIGYPRVRAIAV